MPGEVSEGFLTKLTERRARVYEAAERLLIEARSQGRQILNEGEDRRYRQARADLTALDEQIAEYRADLEALRRGLAIAQDSGNRANKTNLAANLARLEAEHGGTMSAFDHLTLAIRNYHNAGNTTTIRVPLAVLAALFDRLGRYEPAATIAGFALSPFSAAAVPEITTAIAHLRDALGDQVDESLARSGETMTMTAVATYAYDQIDQARAALNAVSK